MDNFDNDYFPASPDPYDFWATKLGIEIRRKYYQGNVLGKTGAVLIGVMDWLLPETSRRLFNVGSLKYPIVIGQIILQLDLENRLSETTAEEALQQISSISTYDAGINGKAWGLGFAWMSKNGLYPSTLPFITHTPYIMEALIVLSKKSAIQQQALKIFEQTWPFLEGLKVMFRQNDTLALSYAPVEEPRIVINANAYAAYSYALHAVYGRKEIRKKAIRKAEHIIRFISRHLRDDGSWYYYADNDGGNFIDCFHSCFVIKNLLKTQKLLPELEDVVVPLTEKGWRFIRRSFYDQSAGLCRRFIERDIKDPFKWDLYDQAEYLGLLIDFNLRSEAKKFAERTEERFKKGNSWYCRIDIMGRRWGRNFLRWGIVPFQYQKCRLISKTGSG